MAGHVKCMKCGIVLGRDEPRNYAIDKGVFTHKPGMCRGDKAKHLYLLGYSKDGKLEAMWRCELDHVKIAEQVEAMAIDHPDVRVEMLNRQQRDRRAKKMVIP